MKNIDVKKWNMYLTLISIINLSIFISYYFYNEKTFNKLDNKLAILVFIYTYICAIRAIWPRVEGPNICLSNEFISLPIIGRTLATFAEVCFAVLFVMVTNKLILNSSKNNFLKNYNFLLYSWNGSLVYLIVLAQIFCWIGIITTNPKYNVYEESIWTFFGISKIIIYFLIYYHLGYKQKNLKYTIPIILICLLVFIFFMIKVDVPMYMKRANEHKENKNLSFLQGIINICKCSKITCFYNDWKEDIPWLSAYFTFAVWFAFGLFLFQKKIKN